MKRVRLALILALLLACRAAGSPRTAAPVAPPPESPAARAEHPRLFFTGAELPALRDRLAKEYGDEFQSFLSLISRPNDLPKKLKAIEPYWGSLNHAFVAVLDPAELERRGFDVPSSIDTPQKLCDKAMGYARTQLPTIAIHRGQGHGDLGAGYPMAVSIPVLATYDWCYPHLADADRREIVYAIVAAYEKKWKGKNPLSDDSVHAMLANNQAAVDIHEALGIVAFYNDPYPSPEVQRALYETFDGIWVNRALVELERFYGNATGWHEGPTAYFKDGYIGLGLPVAMISPALGADYVSRLGYFTKYPIFLAANIKPHSLQSCSGGRCPEYMERWGTVGGGIDGINCKAALLNAGMLRRIDHPNAAITKWAYLTLAQDACREAVTDYGGPMANATLYWFLFGDRGIEPRSPEQAKVDLAQELGLGQYVFRTGYSDPGASQVVFWASPYGMYGHATPEFGSFSIHKFGDLILKPGNSKSGDAKIQSTKFNLFTNTVGIRKGQSDPRITFDGRVVDSFFKERGISTIKVAGKVLARALNGDGFEYVAYDASPAWKPSTADVSQREFVYLRGPADHEFVVVLDRVNTPTPAANAKIWKAWVPTQPEFLGAAAEQPRPGKWAAPAAATVVVTNKADDLRSKKYESAPTHGRLYLKALWPEDARLHALGGPGLEFQSGDDDGTTPWGAPQMTAAMHSYLGWGRIEIVPGASRAYDVFLAAMQFGNADTLKAASPIGRVASEDGSMIGARIDDPANPWVVLFSKQPPAGGAASIAYTVAGSGPARHLVLDLDRKQTYAITAKAAGGGVEVAITREARPGAVTMTASDSGVLVFRVDNGTVLPTS